MMEKKEVPFFTRFLEDQEFPRVKTDIKAGPGNGGGGGGGGGNKQTLRWPTDDEEGDP